MNLSPARQVAIDTALQHLLVTAEAARKAPDLDAVRKELNACFFAVHAAYDIANTIEAETRREALARLETAA